MSVKRYEANGSSSVFEDANGSLVDYSEYSELKARCSALAAENAGLKDEISNITFMRDDDFFGSTQRAQEVMGRLVNVNTPATDAFLAEVRAQGVEMFASKCKEESKRAHSSDARDSWWVSGENAEDFADDLRKGGA